MTPEQLLALTRAERQALPQVDCGSNVDCRSCTNCVRCTNCDGCRDCADCIGIRFGTGLRFVAYGIQLTADQWALLLETILIGDGPDARRWFRESK
jgi:hypothetical protein